MDSGIYANYKESDYFSLNDSVKRGSPYWIVSRSDLVEVLRCPKEWYCGKQEDYNESLKIGSLVDCLMLTPSRFEESYAIRPSTYDAPSSAKKDSPIIKKKWNANANSCKKWEKEQADKGKATVSKNDIDQATTMCKNLKSRWVDDFECTIEDFVSECQTQVLALADFTDPVTGMTVKLRSLIDIVPPEGLWDLKTTRELEPGHWSGSVSSFGYDVQAAMYLAVWNKACDDSRESFGHIIVGNQYPYLTATRYMSDSYLQLGEAKFKAALTKYCQCIRTKSFPGWSPDGLEEVRPREWEMKKWGVT